MPSIPAPPPSPAGTTRLSRPRKPSQKREVGADTAVLVVGAPGTGNAVTVPTAAATILPNLAALLAPESHEPINRQIYRALRQAIFTGAMTPGTPLSEKDVSQMFQVSRQPVREAFIKLAEAGVLQILPQRGTFVRKISVKQVRDGRFIREAIERAVVVQAAGSITDAQLTALANNIKAQRQAAKANDTAAFLALDERFHQSLAESIDCPSAWDAIQDLKAQMDRVRYLTLPDDSPLDSLIKQHSAILLALKRHDAAAADAAMCSHLREILATLGPVAQRHPDWFETI